MEQRPQNWVTPTDFNLAKMHGDGAQDGVLKVKSCGSFHRARGYPSHPHPRELRVGHTTDSPFEVYSRLEVPAVFQVGCNLSCTLCSAEGACVGNIFSDAEIQLFEPPVPAGENGMACVSLTSRFGWPEYDEFCEKAGAVPRNFDVKVAYLENAHLQPVSADSVVHGDSGPKRRKVDPTVVDLVYTTGLYFKNHLDIDDMDENLKRVAVGLMKQGYCAVLQHAFDRGINDVYLGLYPGFNNPERWVRDALAGALHSFRNTNLNVVVMHTAEEVTRLPLLRPPRCKLFADALKSEMKALNALSPATAAGLLVKKAMAEGPNIMTRRAAGAIRDLVIEYDSPEPLLGVWEELIDLATRAGLHFDEDSITVPHALFELLVPKDVPIVRIMVIEPAHVIRQVCTTSPEYAEKLVAAKSSEERDTLWYEGLTENKMFKVNGPYTPADFTSGTYTIFRGGQDPRLDRSYEWGHNVYA